MPVVEAARHKGAEWRVDLAAAERWVREREARDAAARQRYAERYEREREETERLVARMTARQRAKVLRSR